MAAIISWKLVVFCVIVLICKGEQRTFSSRRDDLPVVNLGYVKQQATSYNAQFDYYSFNNIRYAQSTTGQARFTPPIPPFFDPSGSKLDSGQTDYICPQAFGSTAGTQTEDCLFLDVHVPREVFENGNAAVLVWIHGGGYAAGSKMSYGDPSGLLNRSREFGDGKGAIYAAINYRLGAYGWLNGPRFQSSAAIANVGLLDQRFALEWFQSHIHLFGGDPGSVTIMGDSAGGGSIEFQITYQGGAFPAPFKRAIPQSPAVRPQPSNSIADSILENFFSLAGASSVSQLRSLSESSFYAANQALQNAAPFGSFGVLPAPDGFLIPDLPSRLLKAGRFDHNVFVMTGHNLDEGFGFTPPNGSDPSNFEPWIRVLWPEIPESSLSELANVLYPPVYDGSHPYTSPFGRLDLVISESTFSCGGLQMARARNNLTYNYLFSAGNGQHSADVPYTFYVEGNTGVNVDVAYALQRYIVSFVIEGVPSAEGTPHFPEYYAGSGGLVETLSNNGVFLQTDPADNPRCIWWQDAPVS